MNTNDMKFANRAQQHRYELSIDGTSAARIEYKLGEGYVDMLHTEVEPEFEGQGVASRMAKLALDEARAQGLKVVPSCSYIATYIQRHPEYGDIVRPT